MVTSGPKQEMTQQEDVGSPLPITLPSSQKSWSISDAKKHGR